jgi:hypothetical protein
MTHDAEIESPYREVLTGILAFSTFAEVEETLRKLQVLFQQYQSVGDKKGMEYCRQIAVLGRRRAEFISRNKKVRLQKRLQKKEMANWFGVWTETPVLFEDWLLLRKRTEEFKKLLGPDST